MDIQWYPGHMAKARRMLEDQLKLIDIVVELRDARAPIATSNPEFDKIFSAKQRIIVLNKADLADQGASRKWAEHLEKLGITALPFNASSGRNVGKMIQGINQKTKALVERQKQRGINKTVRAMIVGIPNVGKSTFINCLRGAVVAKAANRPGVTRGRQWIVINDYLEFLDTPGLLWPKQQDQKAALNLAFIGSINDEIMDKERLCALLLEQLRTLAPDKLMARLKLDALQGDGHALISAACHRRGWLLSQGREDTVRAANVILDEFRSGKMGAVTLEMPPELDT